MIVLPSLRASLFKSLIRDKALKLSNPEVGSSSRITDGSVISSTPIEQRLRSPPEIIFYYVLPIILF